MALRVGIVGGETAEVASLAQLLRASGADVVSHPGEPVAPDPRAALVLLDHALLAAGGAPLLERVRAAHPAAQICLLAPFAHRLQVAGPLAPLLWDALYLPAQPEDVEDLVSRTAAFVARRRHAERGKRILVVDDEPSLREVCGAHLRQQGHEVDTAVDALEALGNLHLHPYDLVITDLQMPGMDGVALLGKIRAGFPLLPVVLATGHATVETAVAALRTGATDFLRKPFSGDDLVQVVERALRYGDLARANADLEDQARAEKFRLRERQYELRVLAEAITGMSQAGQPAPVADLWLRAACRVVDFRCGALFLVHPEPELVLLDQANGTCREAELFALLRQGTPALAGGCALEGLRVRRIGGVAAGAACGADPPGNAEVRLLGPAGNPCAGVVLVRAAGEVPTPAQESFLRSLSEPAAQVLEKLRALAGEARQREQAMVAGMHHGVLLADPQGRLLVMNAAARDLLGLAAGEECRRLSQLQAGHDVPVQDAVAELLCSGSDTLSREFVLRRPKERILTLELTAIRGDTREPTAVVGLLRDITETRESERMKSEFVSIVSHELRTPLTTIKNCNSLLLGGGTGPISPRQERFLTMAQVSVDRIARLVEDLLDVARIESGRLHLECATFDLALLLREVGGETEHLLLERGLRLACGGLDLPLTICADRDRLKQVFLNLVHNAVKFSPTGGAIGVDAREVAAADVPDAIRALLKPLAFPLVEVRVIDEGVGIAAGDRERIFERFQQVELTLRREHGGIGLGLPIARGIVRSHGGEIWAEPRETGGSVFRVIFPRECAPGGDEETDGDEPICQKPDSAL